LSHLLLLLNIRDHTVCEGLEYVSLWNSSFLLSRDMETLVRSQQLKGRNMRGKEMMLKGEEGAGGEGSSSGSGSGGNDQQQQEVGGALRQSKL
jgi:hypothetical protein